MKKASLLQGKVILAVSLFMSINTYAQENKHLGEPIPQQSIFNSRDGETVDYFTATRNKYNDVSGMKGNPFIIAEWVQGIVVFKGNKLYNCNDLQFNWVTNELHTKYKGQAYGFDDSVIEFVLLDTSNNKSIEVLYRNGYPNIGTHTKNSFYQVIAGGANFELLKYWSRHDHEMYEGTGTYTKEFTKVEDWYLYDMKNNKLVYLNLKPASVEKALPAYTTTVKQVTHSIDGKRLTETDLVSLVNSLNKL
jgi:hypothetical protein